MLLWAWCPDVALPEHTQHAILLLFFLSRLNTSEETVQLWSLSRGNALTSLFRSRNVASGKARWLTAFSTQRGGPFHLPPFKIHDAQTYILTHLLQSPCSAADTWPPSRTVGCLEWLCGISPQSVRCFLQVARLTDGPIDLPIKDHRWAGSSWTPAARTAQ